MKLHLPQVTLLGIDCVNLERLQVAMDICQENIDFGAVKLLTSLSTDDPRAVTISHISSIEDFSRFCIQDLNKYVDTDYVLLVQYDGFIINPQSWTPEFLNYDYIGAPLSWGKMQDEDGDLKFIVGNGGFCLRSKKFLETSARFANEGEIEKFHAEDMALCVWYRDLFEKEGLIYAPVDLGMKFSVVEGYGVYDKPFGFHGLFNKNMDSLLASHPDFPTHFFMPRIIHKRMKKMKERYEEVALEGYVMGRNEGVLFVFKDEDFPVFLEKRHEYYSKINDTILSISEPQITGNPLDEFRSEVVYRTKLGEYKIVYMFCKKSALLSKPEGNRLF